MPQAKLSLKAKASSGDTLKNIDSTEANRFPSNNNTAAMLNARQWTSWKLLSPQLRFSQEALTETLDGGQSFRWSQTMDGYWTGTWGKCLARVRLDNLGKLQWSCPPQLKNTVEKEIPIYFAADRQYKLTVNRLTKLDDPALITAMRRWEGLRILRQPLGETLLAFLCSSAKQITQIKQICKEMAERFGDPIAGTIRTLPSWTRLQEIPERDLLACKMGYRAGFIRKTADALAEQPRLLETIDTLSYTEAKEKLLLLPGVGEKIADCVLLFGAGKHEAFPVDTWMLKSMARLYGLDGSKPSEVAKFGRARFGSAAGLAQQFLFAGERRRKSAPSRTPQEN